MVIIVGTWFTVGALVGVKRLVYDSRVDGHENMVNRQIELANSFAGKIFKYEDEGDNDINNLLRRWYNNKIFYFISNTIGGLFSVIEDIKYANKYKKWTSFIIRWGIFFWMIYRWGM